MRPPAGDAGLLLRAHGRCTALVVELDRLDRALERASGHTSVAWAGAGAAAFGAAAGAHRRTLGDVRAAVTRLGLSTRTFAHELADAQLRAKQLPEEASAERAAIEERIQLLRRRFRQELAHVDSDARRLLLRRPISTPRWTGPVRPPGGWRREQPLDSGRWTGPVQPPGNLTRPKGSIRLLPVPAGQGPAAVPLPWQPPGYDADGRSPAMKVQPIAVST